MARAEEEAAYAEVVKAEMKAIDDTQKLVDRLYGKISGTQEKLDLLLMEYDGLEERSNDLISGFADPEYEGEE